MDVKHVAKLANLTLTADEEDRFSRQFADTLKTIDQINELDTTGTAATPQVTGLTNVTRTDQIDASRVLSRESALSQAARSHNGYFVVPSVFE